MQSAKNNEKEEETALERYKIISPILSALEEKADKGKISQLKSEACREAGVHRKTISRWLSFYAEKGFAGLKYKSTENPTKRKIPAEIVKEAIQLRLEVPTRSMSQIIDILEMEGKVSVGFLKRSTLQDRLREEGFSSAQMKLYQKSGTAARRFAYSERNEMWQADVKFGPYIRIKGKKSQVYFVGFIDDATRYIIHGEFYAGHDQSVVEDCFRKAVLKEGVPRRVYFDNGKEFKNKWMERSCAILGIKRLHTQYYSPESKGKIERFNRTLDSFIAEAVLKKAKSLDEFNELFDVWLAECYHSREHAGIDSSPEIAYKSSKTPLKFLPAETVANAFLHSEKRKVDKSGCINFKNKKYEVGVMYIGKTIDIVYDMADTSVITVDDKHFNTSFQIKPLVIGEHTGPRPKLPEYMTPKTPETSRLLDEKQKRYEKRQLSAKRAISYAQINRGADGKGSDGNV